MTTGYLIHGAPAGNENAVTYDYASGSYTTTWKRGEEKKMPDNAVPLIYITVMVIAAYLLAILIKLSFRVWKKK